MKIRAAPELLSKIVSDAANVSALGACEAKCSKRRLGIAEPKIVDMNQSRLAFHFDPFASKFVKRHAILLDGGNHRRRLHLVANECGGSFVQLFESEIGQRTCLDRFTVRIMSCCRSSEFN